MSEPGPVTPGRAEAPVLFGHLERAGERVPVRVTSASQMSLAIAFGELPAPPSGTEFDRLVVASQDRALTLGRCRLSHALAAPDFPARLVFLDDVYDCRLLVAEGRLKNLVGFFQELPLVLAQKERIRPEFRAYVADLHYDLCVYKRFFNEQDRLLSQEPAVVGEAAQQVLLQTAGQEFFRFLDKQLVVLAELVRDYSPEEHERHGYYFRQQFWPFIIGAEFMMRTNLKPRGYAGDAVMMQMLYDNAYVGQYVFHKLMHKHPLEAPAAQAVRNRRVLISRALRETLEESKASPFRVLSLACGPARELDDIFKDSGDFERVEIVLLDQDAEALDTARKAVERLERAHRATVRARFVNDSVRTMLKSADLPARLGRFDFAYSMGMFDYLTAPVAKAVLAKVYELLAPGGVLLIGNYHVSNPSRFYMAYWLDWILYYRSEEEMMELAGRLPGARVVVGFDESRCQMFLRVVKHELAGSLSPPGAGRSPR